MSPQDVLKDYKEDKYLDDNTKLLSPVYRLLYEDAISAYPTISDEIKESVKKISGYFDMIIKSISNEDLKTQNTEDKLEAIGNTIRKIPESELNDAAQALNNVVHFYQEERTSVNNLSFLTWMLFNESSREKVVSRYIDDLDNLKE